MRREMRVLPVPQGSTIRPRAWPLGRPPESESTCSCRMRTELSIASSCMHDLVCLALESSQ